ncbi:STAS domain-containing protein [Micromonospora terminaliae]|uniref:STAS domain-containing protein n=1 Tax=Micromonospora terminaliae TaxID=1914461 RepID=A0AAJ2ZHG4_9ACTN|nr:STAS domain-containing protein [Micromonospora terminaliae]NES30132.1 STAS domain-containing protein [Micromonospora terminaliae]QGL46700.1 STAS domain-containing protein [Micromonospora terminaliae]
MPAQLLTIEVDRLDAGRARLRLTGELDFDTAPELVAVAAELRRDGCQELLLDFAGVALCDSSGLSALVVIHRAGAGPVRLDAVGPQVRQLLDRTGLAELLAVPPPGETGATREAG